MARRAGHRAFSLIELVIVVVIMGVIAAIAIPRMGSAADNAKNNALKGNLDELQRAVDLYTGEHAGQAPAVEPDGSVTGTPNTVIARLLLPSDVNGTLNSSGVLGPYLRFWPINPINGSNRLRIDGIPAPSNQAGWRYDSTSNAIQSDALVALGVPAGTTGAEQVPLNAGSLGTGFGAAIPLDDGP